MKTDFRLTEAELRAVMDYIWQHARSSPNGTAFKVWQKMYNHLEKATKLQQQGIK